MKNKKRLLVFIIPFIVYGLAHLMVTYLPKESWFPDDSYIINVLVACLLVVAIPFAFIAAIYILSYVYVEIKKCISWIFEKKV